MWVLTSSVLTKTCAIVIKKKSNHSLQDVSPQYQQSTTGVERTMLLFRLLFLSFADGINYAMYHLADATNLYESLSDNINSLSHFNLIKGNAYQWTLLVELNNSHKYLQASIHANLDKSMLTLDEPHDCWRKSGSSRDNRKYTVFGLNMNMHSLTYDLSPLLIHCRQHAVGWAIWPFTNSIIARVDFTSSSFSCDD